MKKNLLLLLGTLLILATLPYSVFANRIDSPGKNVTGVYERLHVAKSLVLLNAALTDSLSGNGVAGITDLSPTGNAITRHFQLELEDLQEPAGKAGI